MEDFPLTEMLTALENNLLRVMGVSGAPFFLFEIFPLGFSCPQGAEQLKHAAFGCDEITSGTDGMSWVTQPATLISPRLNIPHSIPADIAEPIHSMAYSNRANRQRKTKLAHFCFYHNRIDVCWRQ